MLAWFVLFIIFLIILFFLSRSLTQNLYWLFYFLTKDRLQAVQLLTWLLLPGTVIHELAHLLTAEVLGVPTGELTFTPEVREGNEIRAGGLKIAKTGPFKHSLIGLAPILAGITAITSLMFFALLPVVQKIISLPFKPLNYQLLITNYFLLFALFYLIFALSNTMFSSKKDLETILLPLIVLFLFGLAFWLGLIKINLGPKVISFLNQLFKFLDYALLGTIIIDLIFLVLIKLLLKKFPKTLTI